MKAIEQIIEALKSDLQEVKELGHFQYGDWNFEHGGLEIKFLSRQGDLRCDVQDKEGVFGYAFNHHTKARKSPKDLLEEAIEVYNRNVLIKEQDEVKRQDQHHIQSWHKDLLASNCVEICKIPDNVIASTSREFLIGEAPSLIDILESLPCTYESDEENPTPRYIRVKTPQISGHLVKLITDNDSRYYFWEEGIHLSTQYFSFFDENEGEWMNGREEYYLNPDGSGTVKTWEMSFPDNPSEMTEIEYLPGDYVLSSYGKFAHRSGSWYVQPLRI
jgi:hypothetical protein